ncbi:unnamed protein product [Nesidiocoris tenuis]|uniref:Uncharacterized protein n=1 Tax=Nesidiocoris tenuis TaxID=355587 RepID=A0A6H5GWA5_9HEMI|nr:unnamed protein product [Nesidiocoris tenuis]
MKLKSTRYNTWPPAWPSTTDISNLTPANGIGSLEDSVSRCPSYYGNINYTAGVPQSASPNRTEDFNTAIVCKRELWTPITSIRAPGRLSCSSPVEGARGTRRGRNFRWKTETPRRTAGVAPAWPVVLTGGRQGSPHQTSARYPGEASKYPNLEIHRELPFAQIG